MSNLIKNDNVIEVAPIVGTGNRWALISDRIMGGVSEGTMKREVVQDRDAIRMQGSVSLDNNGSFLQMALDLGEAGCDVDARKWDGIQLDVLGNEQFYNLHLRTSGLRHSWDSYRQTFASTSKWKTIQLPFSDFVPHRMQLPLNIAGLRRIGIVAIGREFKADISVADIRFYTKAGKA